MKKEYNLELLLQQDFKDIIDSINIDSNVLLKLEELNKRYDHLLNTLLAKFDYDIKSNIEFTYSFLSYQSSSQIDNEVLDDISVVNNISKLKELYVDKNVINGFYYNFNSNLKKINKSVTNNSPGVFRSENNEYGVVRAPGGDLLVADYKNILKYINELVNINLIKGNNIYVEAWIIHCIFVSIHPFYYGNGQVGRFILNNHLNQLADNKTYIDKTLLKYKSHYYEALFDFQVTQDFESSTHKFLDLLIRDYEENSEIIKNYLDNYQLLLKLISRDTFLNKYLDIVIAVLFTNNIITKKDIYKILNKSDKTNKKILDYLVDYKYLTKLNDALYRPCY